MLATSLSHPALTRQMPQPNAIQAGTAAPSPSRVNSLAILAHDVRGPLANLALLVEAMGDEAIRSDDRRLAGQAHKAGAIIDRLDAMMTAMLERERRSEILRPAQDGVDLTDVVETVVALNGPLARSKKVRVHCFVATPLRTRGDAHLLMQALDNLLTNAITFTRPHGRVLCEAAPGDHGDVVIRIADEGPGLTTAEIAGLFHPFATVQRNDDKDRKSSGLGLAIVRQIATAHGGSVEARSAGPARGSCFMLRLPGLDARPSPTRDPASVVGVVASRKERPPVRPEAGAEPSPSPQPGGRGEPAVIQSRGKSRPISR